MYPIGSLEVSLEDDARDGSDPLLNDTVYWIGHPLVQEPRPFKTKLLHQQRDVLKRLVWDMRRLFFSEEKPQSVQELYTAAKKMSASLAQWHAQLPKELRYHKGMPSALIDFQYAYMGFYCLKMDSVANA